MLRFKKDQYKDLSRTDCALRLHRNVSLTSLLNPVFWQPPNLTCLA